MATDPAVLDVDALVAHVFGCRDLARELIGDLLVEARDRVRGVEEAIEAGDLERAAVEAHRLKGSAGTAQARLMSDAARAAENAARARALADAEAAVPNLRHQLARLAEAIAVGENQLSA